LGHHFDRFINPHQVGGIQQYVIDNGDRYSIEVVTNRSQIL